MIFSFFFFFVVIVIERDKEYKWFSSLFLPFSVFLFRSLQKS